MENRDSQSVHRAQGDSPPRYGPAPLTLTQKMPQVWIQSVTSNDKRPSWQCPTTESTENQICYDQHFYLKEVNLLTQLTLRRESEVAQSCPTLCDPVGCSPPGSSIRGIFQARVLEWVAISFSR